MRKEFFSVVGPVALAAVVLTNEGCQQLVDRAVDRAIDSTTKRVTGAAQKKVDAGVKKVNDGVEKTVESGLNTLDPK